MIGKKNIVFGFLYLSLTAALGPYMILNYVGDEAAAQAAKQIRIGELQLAASNDFEKDLEPMTPAQIAKDTANALLSLSSYINSQEPIDAIKGGAHSHGNLEAVLNILAGFLLMFLGVGRLFKQIISWVFIGGALLHSGMLYLAMPLQLGWTGAWFGSPLLAAIGPALVLAGLVLAGVAALIGLRSTPMQD
jgi:hypothetical protein